MIRLNDISIKNKLIIMLVLTSLLVLGLFFLIFIISDIRSYKERKVEDMIALAQVIGSSNISTLQFEDNDEAEKVLKELHDVNPQITYSVILDRYGKNFADYKRLGADSTIIPIALGKKKYMFSGNELYVTNDISDGKDVIGKIILKVQLNELSALKRSKFRLATFLLLAALGFSFLLAIAVQNYISRRLVNLADTMKEVKQTGDYNKSINDEGKDEISTLIKGFNDLMQQVKENQQRKDEFIGIASHELKTPLTTIKGYMELLHMAEEREPNRQFVSRALENVNKLERLIKELLDVSKIQSGQLLLNIKEFNSGELLNETIQAFQLITKTHQIIWEGQQHEAILIADRQRIEQVFINLLSNAIKYSPSADRVIVNCNKTDKEFVVKVRDFGIGVPQSERLNIFERFYRAKDSSTNISGFGLGLYICKDIIKRHNGNIWMEPEEVGSAFYFSLPLKNGISLSN